MAGTLAVRPNERVGFAPAMLRAAWRSAQAAACREPPGLHPGVPLKRVSYATAVRIGADIRYLRVPHQLPSHGGPMGKILGIAIILAAIGLVAVSAVGLFNSTLDSRVAFLIALGAAGLVLTPIGLRRLVPCRHLA